MFVLCVGIFFFNSRSLIFLSPSLDVFLSSSLSLSLSLSLSNLLLFVVTCLMVVSWRKRRWLARSARKSEISKKTTNHEFLFLPFSPSSPLFINCVFAFFTIQRIKHLHHIVFLRILRFILSLSLSLSLSLCYTSLCVFSLIRKRKR
jgi:hypothetical protein